MQLRDIEALFERMADTRKTYVVEYMKRVWDQDTELWRNEFDKFTENAESKEDIKTRVREMVNLQEGQEFVEFIYVEKLEVTQ
jgi:hypothetical protein